jgi:hypothetical protein
MPWCDIVARRFSGIAEGANDSVLNSLAAGKDPNGGQMNNTRRTYLLTLNSPSQRALRLWMGKSIHTLRHCSVKDIGGALVEMQKTLDDLQKSMRTLQHMQEQLVSDSADGPGGTLKKDNEPSKGNHPLISGHNKASASREMKEPTEAGTIEVA